MLLLSVNFCSRFPICSASSLFVSIHYTAGAPWTSGRRVSKAMPTGFSSRLCNCDRFGGRRARKGHQVDRFLAEDYLIHKSLVTTTSLWMDRGSPFLFHLVFPSCPDDTRDFSRFRVYHYDRRESGVRSFVYKSAFGTDGNHTRNLSSRFIISRLDIDRFEPLAKWNSS